MRRIHSNVLLILLIAAITYSLMSCGAGIGDTSEDLGSGYTYRSEGSHRWINPGSSIYEEGVYGNVLKYNYNKEYIIVLQEPSERNYKIYLANRLMIRLIPLVYDTNSLKNVDIHQRKFMNTLWWKDTILRKKIAKEISPNYFYNDEKVESIVDSVMKSDPYYKRIFSKKMNYWIIRKNDNEVFGPFSKEEYIDKKNELRVPKELELQKE